MINKNLRNDLIEYLEWKLGVERRWMKSEMIEIWHKDQIKSQEKLIVFIATLIHDLKKMKNPNVVKAVLKYLNFELDKQKNLISYTDDDTKESKRLIECDISQIMKLRMGIKISLV